MSARLSKWDSVPGMLIAPGAKSIVAPPSSSAITSTGPFCSITSSSKISSSAGISTSVLSSLGRDFLNLLQYH